MIDVAGKIILGIKTSELKTNKDKTEDRVRLDSKKYYFLVDGTMPVLDFELKSGGRNPMKDSSELNRVEEQKLSLELFAPISGEIFEARTPNGRIEVDIDGTITYFSTISDCVTFSLFLGKNLTVTMNKKTGEVIIKTPSKIACIFDERSLRLRNNASEDAPRSDQLRLLLE